MSVVIGVDFGGTLTDVVVRDAGLPDVLLTRPSFDVVDAEALERVLEDALLASGAPRGRVDLVAVTGGRSRQLPEAWHRARVVKVDETTAIARGGCPAGSSGPVLVVSLGTGTALVLAEPPSPPRHLIGSGIGGGTLMGLSRLLLDTVDPEEVSALSRRGDPGGCDLRVGDILGGGIGSVPADATAGHFARLGRAHAPDPFPGRADVAAALVNLVGQGILRLVFEAAATTGASSVVLLGHLLDVSGFREAIERIPSVGLASLVHIAPEPGYAVARGALAAALGEPAA